MTTPARTALDMACRYPLDAAVTAIDALANAARLKVADVALLADGNRRRGIPHARTVLELVDPGAESPKETWLRLLVIRNGFPPPTTQIPVYDDFGVLIAVLDMGWEHLKLALDYEAPPQSGPLQQRHQTPRRRDRARLDGPQGHVTRYRGGIIRQLEAA